MSRLLGRVALPAFLIVMVGCATHHTGDGRTDAGDVTDASTPDSAVGVDAGSTSRFVDAGAPAWVECGPNRCFHGEVCCSTLCGWCGAAGRCPDDVELCN